MDFKASVTQPTLSPSGSGSSGGGSNAGAIAGGVVGGVAVVALVTFFVWKFCIKNRRQEYEDDNWVSEVATTTDEKSQDDFTHRRDARASTHTVGSIASTVLTRASNIIQIAYIPGVTNRSPPSTPGLLVPPVPPLPSQSPGLSAASTPTFQEQHFFMPSDLRDSTWSGTTGDTRSVARTSVTPSLARDSVATTIYRNNAIIDPLPAQTVIRGKAAVVSVKSSGANTPDEIPSTPAPPVPHIDYLRHGERGLNVHGPFSDQPPLSPSFSVNSAFMDSTANTAKAVTARPVKVTKMTRGPTSAPFQHDPAGIPHRTDSTLSDRTTHSRALRHDGQTSALDEVSSEDSEDDNHARARRSLLAENDPTRAHNVKTIYSDHTEDSSPFGDQAAAASPGIRPASLARGSLDSHRTSIAEKAKLDEKKPAHKASGSLSAVIEEGMRRASRQPTHGGLGSMRRDNSPFSDEYEVKGKGMI
ncbi:MAG: hypothetical protein M1824_006287 [Vezdaea acicularis]|nr:MAG: hypothetical protein M1824_006287 [Vezdaea acicularis]